MHNLPSTELPLSFHMLHHCGLPASCTPSPWQGFCLSLSLLSTSSAQGALAVPPSHSPAPPRYTQSGCGTGVSLLALRLPGRLTKCMDGDRQCTSATNSMHAGQRPLNRDFFRLFWGENKEITIHLKRSAQLATPQFWGLIFYWEASASDEVTLKSMWKIGPSVLANLMHRFCHVSSLWNVHWTLFFSCLLWNLSFSYQKYENWYESLDRNTSSICRKCFFFFIPNENLPQHNCMVFLIQKPLCQKG